MHVQIRAVFEEREGKRDAIHGPLRHIRQMASFALYELLEGRGGEVAPLLEGIKPSSGLVMNFFLPNDGWLWPLVVVVVAGLFPRVDEVLGVIGSDFSLREGGTDTLLVVEKAKLLP